MLDDFFESAAASVGGGSPDSPDAIGPTNAAEISPPKRKKARRTEPQQRAPEQPAGTPIGIEIPPDQMRAALMPFLESMATLTKTRNPEPVEVDGMATNLSYGLANTKIGDGGKTGPWTPLIVAVSLYTIPRMIERLIAYADEKKRQTQEVAVADGERFREVPREIVARPMGATQEGGPIPFAGTAINSGGRGRIPED